MKIKVSIGESLYYMFWILMLAAKGWGLYEGMTAYNICLLLAFVCIIIKVLVEKHDIIEWLVILALLLLGGIVYYFSTEKTPLIYIMMIIGIKNVHVHRIFKIGLPIWGGCMGIRALVFWISPSKCSSDILCSFNSIYFISFCKKRKSAT